MSKHHHLSTSIDILCPLFDLVVESKRVYGFLDYFTFMCIILKKGNVMKNPALYSAYYGIKSRCFNPDNKAYHRYGGRGITCCKEWVDSYKVFETYILSIGWKVGLQIDRIDNNGHYEPGNVRCVSATENCRNSSQTKLNLEKAKEIVQLLNNKVPNKEIAQKYGISRECVQDIKKNKTWKDAGIRTVLPILKHQLLKKNKKVVYVVEQEIYVWSE